MKLFFGGGGGGGGGRGRVKILCDNDLSNDLKSFPLYVHLGHTMETKCQFSFYERFWVST